MWPLGTIVTILIILVWRYIQLHKFKINSIWLILNTTHSLMIWYCASSTSYTTCSPFIVHGRWWRHWGSRRLQRSRPDFRHVVETLGGRRLGRSCVEDVYSTLRPIENHVTSSRGSEIAEHQRCIQLHAPWGWLARPLARQWHQRH